MWLPFPSTSYAVASRGTIRLLLMLSMSPGIDNALTWSNRAPRSADHRLLIAQWSCTNAEWLSMFIVPPRVAGKKSIEDKPDTNTGTARPVESRSGMPLASVAKSELNTYDVDDCELPPVRWLRNHSNPAFVSWRPWKFQ